MFHLVFYANLSFLLVLWNEMILMDLLCHTNICCLF